MTTDQLRKKYQAEVDAYKKIGLYKRYSFLLRLSGDHFVVRNILLEDNFSKSAISDTKSKLDYYHKKKNQSMMPGSAF